MKAFRIIVEPGQSESIESETEKPFAWFPELKPFFKQYNIKKMYFDIDLTKEPTTRQPELERLSYMILLD